MNGEKVEHEHRNEQECIILAFIYRLVECTAEVFHCLGCLEGRKRCKPDVLLPFAVGFGDDVVGVLESTANLLSAVRIEVSVQLEDVVGANGDVFIVLVYGGQYLPIAGNLLF